jgi:hypothetical protein
VLFHILQKIVSAMPVQFAYSPITALNEMLAVTPRHSRRLQGIGIPCDGMMIVSGFVKIGKTKHRGLSPLVNCTDGTTAPCRRS